MARNTGIPYITVARSVELTAHHPSVCPEPLRTHRWEDAQQTAQMRQIWSNMAVFFKKYPIWSCKAILDRGEGNFCLSE